jgi:CxxC motif-containing protein
METKYITCTICPLGCRIAVRGGSGEDVSAEGAGCRRGEAYAREELIRPVRILTSTAVVSGGACLLVPLRSSRPIPKTLLTVCMEEINRLRLRTPVWRGEILIRNVLGTGADIIATGSVDRRESTQQGCMQTAK